MNRATSVWVRVLLRTRIKVASAYPIVDTGYFTPRLRYMSSLQEKKDRSYKLVVVGGGSGGCSVASSFSRYLGKGHVAVIEPNQEHYYQPLWTLVGGGLKNVEQSKRPMVNVLPQNCDWIQDKVVTFDPEGCSVTTRNGSKISYEYLVVAMGLQLDFDKVTGLVDAIQSDPMVVCNYSVKTVSKTFPALQSFKRGKAIFTYPNTPIKCAGAAQKIMYLTDDFFRKNGNRDQADIEYFTSLGMIFGVKYYAEKLEKIAAGRNINVNYLHNLIEVQADKREAIFAKINSEAGETVTVKYDLLHVTPPMSAPNVIKASPLTDTSGYVNVNKQTLQHVKYSNIFSLGDCTNIPTSKTAAAVACQSGILQNNLKAVMKGNSNQKMYDGYTSCPIVTSSNKCLLAEFDFDNQPLETFPFKQAKERSSMFFVKSYFLPFIYWNLMTKGYWRGPKFFRKLMHLGLSK